MKDLIGLNEKSLAVALSGGADSVCLLHVLYTLKEKYGYNLCALHLNHGIRGKEAKRDEDFCRQLCEKLGVPLKVKTTDVPGLRQKGESTETAARRLRYEFFDGFECDLVAVAHNKNDSAETALFNLLRGSGTKGAKGISEKRGKYIRPILLASKSEILAYCRENGLDFVTDSTNLVNDCCRNIIRNEIFPLFEKINPAFVDNIVRFSSVAAKDDAYLTSMAQKALQSAQDSKGVNLAVIDDKAYPILSRVIIEYLTAQGFTPDHKTVTALYNAAQTGENIKINISKNTFAQIKNGALSVIKPPKSVEFSVNTQIVNNFALKNTFDRDKVVGNYEISVRCAGDTFKPKGRPTKELRRLYNDRKIPVNLRDNWPVIRDKNGVIWVYKIGVCERVAPDENSKEIIQVEVEERYVNS
ncbi:MAG: tRNA lysidine(34) synthetase TilS [Oscillospiraceae bacterium]|nr:tRNA lysidine(34) synthetase TilS [Candidatus Equicaccousia limihippi]